MAQQRREQLLEQKKRKADVMAQRTHVLERKSQIEDKISDIMSFVSNSENIWEYIGNEEEEAEKYS